jgi:hypothetical protein
MADLVTLRAWLTEAETARHQLVTGALAATVRYNGQNEVTFAKTEIGLLDSYIGSLQSQIAALDGTVRQTARPLYLTF